jgi:hypothetical protein
VLLDHRRGDAHREALDRVAHGLGLREGGSLAAGACA